MRYMRVALSIIGCMLLTAGACNSPTAACGRDQICVSGTIRHFGFEGGFWAVRGDDSVTYDPVGGVPQDFQSEGLRVHLIARERRDMSGIHMAGPIVEIISIRRQ